MQSVDRFTLRTRQVHQKIPVEENSTKKKAAVDYFIFVFMRCEGFQGRRNFFVIKFPLDGKCKEGFCVVVQGKSYRQWKTNYLCSVSSILSSVKKIILVVRRRGTLPRLLMHTSRVKKIVFAVEF